MMSWGHDEYMYQVLKHNKSNLPEEALYIIRYASVYNMTLNFLNFENIKLQPLLCVLKLE
jgi:hypothetical protein